MEKAELPLPNFEASGPEEGECVVLIHGWGSSAELMRPIANMLNDAYRVVNIDLPGHGNTPPPTSAIGVPECAELVAGIITTELGRPVTIVGHSNGGRIAMYMASDERFRQLIRRLILISPSGIRPVRSLKVRAKSLVASVLKAPFRLLPDGLERKGLEWLRDSSIWRMLGSSDYRSLSGVMRETFVKTVNHFLDDRVGRISVPTLIFRGDSDTAVGVAEIEKLKAAIPDVGVVTLKGAGHYGYLDSPSTVAAGMRHFLQSETGVKTEGRER